MISTLTRELMLTWSSLSKLVHLTATLLPMLEHVHSNPEVVAQFLERSSSILISYLLKMQMIWLMISAQLSMRSHMFLDSALLFINTIIMMPKSDRLQLMDRTNGIWMLSHLMRRFRSTLDAKVFLVHSSKIRVALAQLVLTLREGYLEMKS